MLEANPGSANEAEDPAPEVDPVSFGTDLNGRTHYLMYPFFRFRARMPVSRAAAWGLAALGSAAAVGTAVGLSRGTKVKVTAGSLKISVTPLTLTDAGGTVTISGTAKNFATGAVLTVVENGKTTTSKGDVTADGSFSLTHDIPANTTKKAVKYTLYVTGDDKAKKKIKSNKVSVTEAAS